MPKDLDFDQLYPNRFIKSGEFQDRPVTLTIAEVTQEELEGSSGKKVKVIVSFRETKKQWVAPKTCGIALRMMFGRKVSGWVGKRVTLYPTDVSAFGEIVQAIRVLGSPDLAEAIEAEEQLGRAKAKFKLIPTGKKDAAKTRAAAKPKPPPEPPPPSEGLPGNREPPESTDEDVEEFESGFANGQ